MSLTQFVSNGCIFDSYWTDTGTQPLTKKLTEAHSDLLKGMHGFEMFDDPITVYEVKELLEERPSSYMLCSYLRQVGYLSIVGNERWRIPLGCPNRETEELIAKIIAKA